MKEVFGKEEAFKNYEVLEKEEAFKNDEVLEKEEAFENDEVLEKEDVFKNSPPTTHTNKTLTDSTQVAELYSLCGNYTYIYITLK